MGGLTIKLVLRDGRECYPYKKSGPQRICIDGETICTSVNCLETDVKELYVISGDIDILTLNVLTELEVFHISKDAWIESLHLQNNHRVERITGYPHFARLVCSRYITIENMDELLGEDDVMIKMIG